ncbi:MAG: YdcF family protein [Pseudomonadota bacterium]
MQRLFLGFILLILLWGIGLAVFIGSLPAPSRDAPPRTDGVTVYTGGGGARIAAGMNLFAEGTGQRLLISGVHPDTTRNRLSELWEGSTDLFTCCVDLGREAMTTNGNATEASQWAETNNYDEIVLVTSDYHMPRAIASTRARMPDVTVHPYVVASGYLDGSGRPTSRKAWKKLAGEYTKYVLARIKAFIPFVGN